MTLLVFPEPTARQFLRCRNFVLSTGTTNASRVARAIGIGFNEAMTYLEQMERDGVISHADDGGRRFLVRDMFAAPGSA